MTDTQRSPIGEVTFSADGLMWHRLDTGIAVTEAAANETLDVLRRLTGDGRVASVVDMRGVAFADRQARDVFGRPRDDDFETATALVVDSPVSRALGNLYLRFSRPARPTQMFTSEEAAAAWARQFVPQV